MAASERLALRTRVAVTVSGRTRVHRQAVRITGLGRVSGSRARTRPDPRTSARSDRGINVHPARNARSPAVQGIQPVPVGTRRRREVVPVPMAPIQSDPLPTGPILPGRGAPMPVRPDHEHTGLGRPVHGRTAPVHGPTGPTPPGLHPAGAVPSGGRRAALIDPRARAIAPATAGCRRAGHARPKPHAHSSHAHSSRVRRRSCARCSRRRARTTDPPRVRRPCRRTTLAARQRRFVRALRGAFSGSIADPDHRRSARLRSPRRPT